MTKKVEQTAKEKLRNFLNEKRRNGELKLPPERELCKLFNVSRITLSKILTLFAGEGLIVRKQGSGTYIAENERLAANLTVGIGFGSIYNPKFSSYSKIINSLSKHAAEINVDIQIFDRITEQFERSEERNSIIRSIEAKIVDGFIIAGLVPSYALSKINSLVPTVVINSIAGLLDVVSVSCDYVAAAFLATDYLLNNGHTKIALIYKEEKHPQIAKTISGYKLALQSKCLTVKDEYIFDASGKKANDLEKYLEEIDATAILAQHDRIAEQVAKIMFSKGLKIPDNISLMGIGNFDPAGHLPFGLTTVDARLPEISEMSLNLINKMCSRKKVDKNIYILEPIVVERDSVKKI